MMKVRAVAKNVWRRAAVGGACCAVFASTFGLAQATQKVPADSSSPAPSGQTVAASTAPAATPANTPDRAQAYYHFALGHMYEESAEQSGRPEMATQAIEQYKLAITDDPDSEFLQSDLAETYFKLGRIREAVETAQQILKKDPNDLDAHKLLGRVYLRSLGDPDSGQQPGPMLGLAIEEFQKIVQLEPNKVDNHLLLGQLYTLKHDTDAARAQFEEARKINPGSEDVVLNLARLDGEQGNVQQAVDVLSSVSPDQRTPKIDLALGAAYDQLKQPTKAIDAYQNALTEEPDNLDAQRGLAEDLLSTNQTDAALKLFQGITTQDPEDIRSFLRLAELERMQGHLNASKTALEHAKSLDPDSVEVQYNEAMLDQAQGDLDKAATLLQPLAEKTAHANGQYTSDEKNNRAIFLDRLAAVYRNQSKTTQAVDVYKQMIELGGSYAERGYQGEIDAYRDAKMWPEATAAARQAVQALPKSTDLQLTLASELADTGNAKEGVALAKAQLNGSKKDRVVWLTLAQMYTRLHKWKDAASALDQADKLGTGKQDAALVAFLRGALQERQKHYDAAEQQFRESLSGDPNNALALNYLGYMLAEHNTKLDEALQLVQHAVKLDPENGAYLDSLGWVRYKLGQYGLAEQELQKASSLIPTDPTVHDHLGEVYASQGHLHEAVAQWENSLHAYANSAPGDVEASDVDKVRKKLEKAKVKLAREEANKSGPQKPQP